jgi:hypothetical protein
MLLTVLVVTITPVVAIPVVVIIVAVYPNMTKIKGILIFIVFLTVIFATAYAIILTFVIASLITFM